MTVLGNFRWRALQPTASPATPALAHTGRVGRAVELAAAAVVLVSACAPTPAPAGQPPAGGDSLAQASGPKRITVAVSSNPSTLRSKFPGGSTGGAAAGVDALEDLVHAGASRRDDADALFPVLAEAVPSIENGLWKVNADGTMETTWTVKSGARWQDGTAFTSQDLVFTLIVCLDREIVAFCGDVGPLSNARALDDRTVTVSWKQPFIDADTLFTTKLAMPMPRHLLERAYQESKAGFSDLPYWNREFVGAGPFQVRDWLDGSHMMLAAFEGFVLGRPKIDEIVVKFVSDTNALVANMLAGEIETNIGRGMSLDQALEVREQYRGGRLEVGLANWVVGFPQFIDPRPAVLLDVPFRRALVHAIDRQEMVDAFQGGLVPVRHAYFDTSQPQYRDLDHFVMKYDFDPRRAAQLIESTGYVRGADGWFRDSSGQRLRLEIRTCGGGVEDIQGKSVHSIADYWRRAGSEVEEVVVSPARMANREYVATRPGFMVCQNPEGTDGLRRIHSSQTPLPENSYGQHTNTSRYMNPEFDALLERYFSTIRIRERMEVLGRVLQHSTEQVTVVGLFSGTYPKMVSDRLLRVGPRKVQESTDAWNAYEWDVR